MPTPPITGNDGIVPNISSVEDYKGPSVYQLILPDTNEYYIGATSKTDQRLKNHIYSLKNNRHENVNIQNSFNSSMNKNIEIAIFKVDDSEMAFSIEKELIKIHKGKDNFLNIRDSCPPPMLGRKHSEETKKKISDHHKEYYKDPEMNPFFGKKHSEETKEKIREHNKKYFNDPVIKEKHKCIMTERMKDPANREVSRQAAINQWKDPTYRSEALIIRKKQFSDPIFRNKNKQSQIERMKDPANREVSRQAAINQWKDPEIRKKIIEMKCKKIIIDGILYNSVREAVSILGDYKIRLYKKLNKIIEVKNDKS